MPEPVFLAYIPDLFGTGDLKAVVGQAGLIEPLSLQQIGKLQGPVVSYEVNLLVDQLRLHGTSCPPQLIDIADALRLEVGRSKGDGGARIWDVWRALRRHSVGDQKAFLTKELFFAQVNRPSDEGLDLILKSGCEAVAQAWDDVMQALEKRGELNRFLNVEVPVQRAFFQRQHRGVRLDKAQIQAFLSKAKQEKYESYIRVAKAIGVSPTGLNLRNVGQYLSRTDAKHLEEFGDQPDFEAHFRLAAKSSEFAKDFLQFVRSSRDVNTLNRMTGGAARIHPFFQVMGTVTGRILVSEPPLQQLKRSYRSVVSADEGSELVYLDFRQFEPGIMAHLSEDAGFIKSYNSQDLYTALSIAVFDTPDQRKISKQIFLSFCYGMTRAGMIKLLAGANASVEQVGDLTSRLDAFFEAYPGLESLKAKLGAELVEKGFIDTLNGNRRYRTSDGEISLSERRWCLSQRIQGTASLIFKTSLNGIVAEFGDECVLLPMHDAILLQFPAKAVRSARRKCADIMMREFSVACPSIVPKVSDEAFAAE